jgi:ABC-type multidrug transport system fused ATPase/permease subunit
MMGWLALFPAQAWLMATGRGRTHKHLGRLSIILAIAMIVTSLQVAIALTIEFQNAMLLAFNATVVVSFVGFYAFAIFAAATVHTGLHRRLMLFTTLSIIGPAVGRVFDVLDMSEALALPVILALKIVIPVFYDMGASGLRRLTMLLI